MKHPHIFHKWKWIRSETLTIFSIRAYYECTRCSKTKTTILP